MRIKTKNNDRLEGVYADGSHIFLIWEYPNCSDMDELSEIPRVGGEGNA